MTLSKYRIGDLLQLCETKNNDLQYDISNVKGISIQKKFIETKADMTGVSLKPYYLVHPDDFAYVTVTSRNGEKITLAHNTTHNTYIVSSSYVVFRVIRTDLLLSDFLFIYFNRPEFDRYTRFNSWGSARETFDWADMCDMELELPSIEIQQKYVDIYNAMVANQQNYERGLDDLKLVCDAYIDKIKKQNRVKLSKYITRRTEKNTDFSVKHLVGVGKDGFINPKQSKDETNGHICYLVKKNDFVFAPPQLHCGSIDFYNKDEVIKCSDAYVVFYINNENYLDPRYLKMILTNPNIQHYIWYMRDGVREQFNFDQLSEMNIPLPKITEQRSIAKVFDEYEIRKEINDKLKAQIKNICPILIKGSLDEAKALKETAL